MKEHPKGLKENLKVAKRGGNVSKIAKETYELETGNSAITSQNNIGITYEKNESNNKKNIQ